MTHREREALEEQPAFVLPVLWKLVISVSVWDKYQ